MVRLGLKVEGDRSKAGCRSKLHCYTKRNFAIWGSPQMGVPQNGWFIMENPSFFFVDHGGPALVWDTSNLRLSCREVITHYQIKSYQRWWGYSARINHLWPMGPITCDHFIGDSVIPNDRCLFFWALA